MTVGERRLTPSPYLGGATAYRPPRPAAASRVTLRLDGNEGQPPPARLVEEIASAGLDIVRRYPDASGLERALAESMGVDPGRVIVTAGGDDAIERTVRTVLAPGRSMVLPVPTFEMFERYAALAGCDVVRVPWASGGFPVDGIRAAMRDDTAMVVAVTPNSPTGLAASRQELEATAAACRGALLLVDLAYVEFADEDLTGFVLGLPDAVVVRSMSKAWGMAGLRVGWAAGPAGIIGWMRAAGHPYAVSGPSLFLAAARIEGGRRGIDEFVSCVRREREALSLELAALGASVLPSQANFLLARFGDADAVFEGLAERGIGVRIFPGKPLLDGCLRITLPGRDDEFERLVKALREVVKGDRA